MCVSIVKYILYRLICIHFSCSFLVLKPFAQKVIGKAGVIIIPILVSVSTFGATNATVFVASR